MLILTIINALPVKQRMKNAFLENHIFTEYNLDILLELLYYTVDWTATLWIVVVSSGYSSHFFSCLYTQRDW